MELDQKKEIVIKCVRLGMSLASAMILAACDDLDTDRLNSDANFLRRVRFVQKEEELALLRDHQTARIIAAQKGNTKPIEWMLTRFDPERYGGKDAGDTTPIDVAIYLPEKDDDRN